MRTLGKKDIGKYRLWLSEYSSWSGRMYYVVRVTINGRRIYYNEYNNIGDATEEFDKMYENRNADDSEFNQIVNCYIEGEEA